MHFRYLYQVSNIIAKLTSGLALAEVHKYVEKHLKYHNRLCIKKYISV